MKTEMWLHKRVEKALGHGPHKMCEGEDYTSWTWWLTPSRNASVTVVRTVDVYGVPSGESLSVTWLTKSGAQLSAQGVGKLGIGATIAAYVEMRSIGLTATSADNAVRKIATHLEPELWASVEKAYV